MSVLYLKNNQGIWEEVSTINGHTPVITASKSNGITTIYADGTTVATINDGEKGEKGEDGETPLSAFPNDTASGQIVHITDGADDIPMDSVKVNIEPVQDLNGQSNPYPAGGGKNKLQTTLTSKTEGGVTFTVNPDGTFSAVGTASQAQVQVIVGKVSLLAGEYVISDDSNFARGNGIEFYITGVSGATTKYADNARFTLTESVADKNVYFYIAQGTTVNATIKPMIRLALITDSTYAPYSNICPISGWTGAQVVRAGKNLYNKETAENGFIVAKNGQVQPNDNYKHSDYIYVFPDMTYSITNTGFIGVNGGAYYDINKNYVREFRISSFPASFTVPSGCYYMRFSIDPIYLDTIQLELGSTATAYEPYQGNLYPITFPSEAGTVYGGTLDVTNGTLTVDRAMVDLGTLQYTYVSSYTVFVSGFVDSMKASKSNVGYCDRYRQVFAWINQDEWINNDKLFTLYTDNDNRIRVKDTDYTDATAFKTAMNGVQFVYELAEPITYTLTPTEIKSLYGENNIYADCGSTSVTYRADTTSYIGKIITATKSGTVTTVYVKDKPIATINDGTNGKDYTLTTQDKADIAQQVINILPTAQGVSF